MKRNILMNASLILITLTCTRVSADVIDQTTATGGLDIAQTYIRMNGQTFQPSLPYLTAVEWWDYDGSAGSSYTASQVLKAEIWTVSESVIVGGPLNGDNQLNLLTKLGEASRTAPLFTSAGGQWSGRFELGSIDVSAYTSSPNSLAVLFIVPDNSHPAEAEFVNFHNGNPYPNGKLFSQWDQDGIWTDGRWGPSRDLAFRTYGDTIPEPSSAALLFAGSAMVLSRYRRSAR